MNERIHKLAEQAGVKMNAYGRPIPASLASNFDELVELIVGECAEVCHKLAEDSDSYVVHDGDTCAEQIKKHFGVEE